MGSGRLLGVSRFLPAEEDLKKGAYFITADFNGWGIDPRPFLARAQKSTLQR